ncbi:TPA: hypothetical protein EYP44_05130 [Candidatus Bathyarchaeota archaeon]|nr:hypothetical protein [Candidatus Bathyarchaeota archaeon]
MPKEIRDLRPQDRHRDGQRREGGGPGEALKPFAKARDVGAHETMLIAVPKASGDTKLFAERYGVRRMETPQLDQALGRFEEDEARKARVLKGE